MKTLTLAETADYLKSAIIETTADHGFAIVHTGHTPAGHRFVLVNDHKGDSVITESM